MIRATLTDPAGVVVQASWDHDGQADGDLLTQLSGWVGGVGVRTSPSARLGHGNHSAPTFREGRAITLELMAERDSRAELWDLERAWSGLFADGGTGRLEVVQDDESLWCQVRLDGEVKPTTRVDAGHALVSIPLAADDPWVYAPEQRVAVAAPGTGIGLRFPLFSEGGVLTYGTVSAATTGVLVNRGTAPAWPVFWPRGQFVNGWRIWQDGHLIEWNGVAVDVAQSADTARRAVEIWGTDVSQFLTADDFRPIAPGGSAEIRFEPLGGGTGILEATVASTYI